MWDTYPWLGTEPVPLVLEGQNLNHWTAKEVSQIHIYIHIYIYTDTDTHTHTHIYIFNSVQFSSSVVSDSLRPHGLQHTRPTCPSPTPRVYSNSCPLSWWCLPTIPFSVVPFSSCLQSFPASGSFQMSHLFASDGQSIGVSALTSVLPMNTQE